MPIHSLTEAASPKNKSNSITPNSPNSGSNNSPNSKVKKKFSF